MITVQLVGGLGKTVPQLHLVERSRAGSRPAGRAARPCPRRDDRTRRTAGWSTAVRWLAEVELRLATGDPDQADELDLLVFLEGAAEELEFPVGPPAHVEHPVGPTPLIDDDQPAVVGERLLAGCRVVAGACSAFFSSEAANAWT